MSRKYMQDAGGHTRIAAATSDEEHACEHGSLHNHSPIGFPRELGMQNSYEVSDFLNLQDEAFLSSSYRAILGRMPDDDGREHFLSCLRNGTLTKTDILGRLRYSQEGRIRKVQVHGLLPRFFLNSLYKLPLLGYTVKIFTSVLILPSIVKNFQILESRTSAQHNLVSHSLDQKADKQLVDDLKRVLEHLAVQKADAVRVEQIHDAFAANIENIFKTIYEHTTLIMDQQRRLHVLLDEAKKCIAMSMGENKLETFVSEYDHVHDALYVLFEEKFRGTREEIRQRLQKYLHFIQRAGAGTSQYPVLDLGCGRGEWLELLENTGYTAAGIDLNRVMVEQCRARNLNAAEADALGYLRDLPDGSLGALTSFHMVEHIPWRDVVAVFDEAFRVLRPGGCVIFETPNPENLIVGSCTFYNDPLHVRPIPPATLEYLAQARGFVDATIMRSSPLHFFETPPEGGMARMMDIFNCGQDYAVIAFKKNA
ncbi:MAG: methyltransferase domain-containing protein [Deltaproteobacteria bacterium]|nr:methyltransferase domain-containing protein [Deltaproteobacteria bacterium]